MIGEVFWLALFPTPGEKEWADKIARLLSSLLAAGMTWEGAVDVAVAYLRRLEREEGA